MCDVASQVGNNNRQAVYNGVFAETLGVSADKNPFGNGISGSFKDYPYLKGGFNPRATAYRAQWFKCFKVEQLDKLYPPMITVGHPGGRIFPTGPGMGATQLG